MNWVTGDGFTNIGNISLFPVCEDMMEAEGEYDGKCFVQVVEARQRAV